jgi:hypothetical protein
MKVINQSRICLLYSKVTFHDYGLINFQIGRSKKLEYSVLVDATGILCNRRSMTLVTLYENALFSSAPLD